MAESKQSAEPPQQTVPLTCKVPVVQKGEEAVRSAAEQLQQEWPIDQVVCRMLEGDQTTIVLLKGRHMQKILKITEHLAKTWSNKWSTHPSKPCKNWKLTW